MHLPFPRFDGRLRPSQRFAVLAVAAAIAPLTVASLAVVPVAHATEYEFSWSHPRPQGNALGGADFEDASTGYAVGDGGSVVKTTDGGLSWSLVEHVPPFATDLEDVLVLAPGHLLAVGAPPGIFASVDGGATWAPVLNPSTARLYDLERISGTELSAVGAGGQVLRSADDGATWVLRGSFGSDAYEQFWWDSTKGYVLGQSRARRTTDGGNTWLPLNGVPDQSSFTRFGDILFTDAAHGCLVADFDYWLTTNGGASWTSGFFPGPVVYVGNALALTAQHWIAVSNLEGASVYETTDAGATWDAIYHSGAGAFLDLDRLSDGTLLTIAAEGDIFRSTDNGATWSNRIDAAAPQRQTLGAICAWPGGRGAAGTTGTPGTRWYESTDGGATFHHDPSGPAIAFCEQIDYWDADRAVAAGDYGKMWRTINGGADWSSTNLPGVPSSGAAWHVSLPAPGIAFAGVTGQSQCLCYRTTDYGASWQSRSTGLPTGGGWTGVAFVDADHGYLAGYSGGIGRLWKTTDGGGLWTQVATSGLPSNWIWDMHWHDMQTGVATIYNSPGGIYRTTNGGTTWTNVWSTPARELDFSDPLHGVAGPSTWGAQGTLFATDDGGATWQTLVTPSTAAGSTVAALPDGFLVGGDSGVILKATRVDPAGAEDESPPAAGRANRAVLRAATGVGRHLRVSFELPAAGPADLSIIDVQGRHVASLRRGQFEAGRRVEATWDGTCDDGAARRGGVYFARLSYGGEARAVKLVFVE